MTMKFTTAAALAAGLAAMVGQSLAWTTPVTLSRIPTLPATPSLKSPFSGRVNPFSTASSSTALSVSLAPPPPSSSESPASNLPELGDDGVYHISDRAQHQALLEAHPDKLLVLKVYAPWCRACKGLEPKFLQLVHSEKYKDLPLLWADLSIKHNKEFVKEIGVLALPTIQFYVGRALTDNFPCGPSKVPILKRKLAAFVNEHVDSKTRLLKDSSVQQVVEAASAPVAPVEKEEVATPTKPQGPTTAQRDAWSRDIPYFSDMALADKDAVLDKAKLLTFEPGSILMREGRPGRTFYIIERGEVEICQTSMVDDPLTTPSSYLGTVINRLGPGDWFGERALMTGEPRAASIRADSSSNEAVQCWTFDKDDFPASSVLSGKTKMAGDLDMVDDKYGVAFMELFKQNVDSQIRDSQTASQTRGSVNTPQVLKGVDTEDDIDAIVEGVNGEVEAEEEEEGMGRNDEVFSLLARFKMIRSVRRCFEYIVASRAKWGEDNPGIRQRRNMLVSRLTAAQRAEFTDAFKLIDVSGDGIISLLELKRAIQVVGQGEDEQSLSDEELLRAISTSTNAHLDGESVLTFQDFMGIMAETEFYHLFRDIFASLDPDDTGFVKAGDLERVLCGVRDLISDDRKSIIDVEDDDLSIDYEQFSRMLLGTALI